MKQTCRGGCASAPSSGPAGTDDEVLGLPEGHRGAQCSPSARREWPDPPRPPLPPPPQVALWRTCQSPPTSPVGKDSPGERFLLTLWVARDTPRPVRISHPGSEKQRPAQHPGPRRLSPRPPPQQDPLLGLGREERAPGLASALLLTCWVRGQDACGVRSGSCREVGVSRRSGFRLRISSSPSVLRPPAGAHTSPCPPLLPSSWALRGGGTWPTFPSLPGGSSRGPCSPRGRVDTQKRSHTATATVPSPSPCWQAGALLPLHKPTGSFLGGRCWGHRLAYSTDPAGSLRPGGPAGPSLCAQPACSRQHTHRLPPFPLP